MEEGGQVPSQETTSTHPKEKAANRGIVLAVTGLCGCSLPESPPPWTTPDICHLGDMPLPGSAHQHTHLFSETGWNCFSATLDLVSERPACGWHPLLQWPLNGNGQSIQTTPLDCLSRWRAEATGQGSCLLFNYGSLLPGAKDTVGAGFPRAEGECVGPVKVSHCPVGTGLLTRSLLNSLFTRQWGRAPI